MTNEVDMQRASACDFIPDDSSFRRWAQAALEDRGPTILTIRVVDREESADLNMRYRSREGATNVLSFAVEVPVQIDLPILGDIVICAPLVAEEAAAQGKTLEAHWAHLVVHGVLHLLGFDHETESEAQEMESREILLLIGLGFSDPYA